MLLSATTKEDQPVTDLHTVQNQNHALVRNKQKRPARCWLTACSKPRAGSCQGQAGETCQMLTHSLFKTQNMLLSEASSKGPPDAGLHPVQKPENAPVSNKQGRLAKCWLTSCSNPGQAPVSNKQEEPARCWLTNYSKPRVCSFQQQVGKASEMPYILYKTQSIVLSVRSRKS